MATVTPKELLTAWKLEQMPLEMTMGHVVQNLVILRDEIDRLIAHTQLPPNPKGKAKPSKSDEILEPE
jgi:hypothetical protein